MLGALHAEPTMRTFLLSIAILMPATSGAAPAEPVAVAVPACVAVAASRSGEPPAWVLLAAAVVLLGAGRLAAS